MRCNSGIIRVTYYSDTTVKQTLTQKRSNIHAHTLIDLLGLFALLHAYF